MTASELLRQAATARGYTAEDLSAAFGQSVLRLSHKDRQAWVIDGHNCSGTDLASALLFRHKHSLKALLAPLGIPTPAGIHLDAAELEGGAENSIAWQKATSFMQRGVHAYVCKPAYLGKGKAIHLSIDGYGDLEAHVESWAEHFQGFVLEEKCPGNALDLLVLHGKVVAVREKSALSLIGDGQQSLEELIAAHNARPGQAHIIEMNAAVRQLLREQRLYLGEVVPAGQSAILSRDAASAADANLLEALHTGFVDWAARIAAQVAAPMIQLGLLVGDPTEAPEGQAVVLKCDPSPEWMGFVGVEGGLAIADALVEVLVGDLSADQSDLNRGI